jgi:N-acetylmuramoyl-L-alanine amidase
VVAAVTVVGVALAGQADAEVRADPPKDTRRGPVDVGSVGLGPRTLSAGPGDTTQTRRLDTAPFEMVAVTWHGPGSPGVEVRTRSIGSWSRWQQVDLKVEHAPGPATSRPPQVGDLRATELLWVGRSDGVQVRLDGQPGSQARVLLVDPGTLPSDTRVPSAPSAPSPGKRAAEDAGPASDATDAPQPNILTRSDWGADESWRSSDPRYSDTIEQAHIHHTAGSNDYTRADVPAIIRGDYWYHTQVLGWSDLGYNFVVDKFGRIWEGRAGGIDRAVLGAHTLGFNHDSFGVAAIGRYGATSPSSDLVSSLVRLTAWKLDAYDREPAGHTRVRSAGSDRYPEGTWVRLPVIDGHRDTNETVCPGDELYAKLPDIRRRAQDRADAVHAPTGSPAPGGSSSPVG